MRRAGPRQPWWPPKKAGLAELQPGPKGLLCLQLPLDLSPSSKPSWKGRQGGEEGEKEEEGREGAAPKSLTKRTTALSANSLLSSSACVHGASIQHRAGAQSRPSARVQLVRGQHGTRATVLDAG